MKRFRIFSILLSLLLISLSAHSKKDKDDMDGKPQWDFDHQVNFTQIEVGHNTFRLVVRAATKTPFHRLSAFVFRRSYFLCRQYGYDIQVNAGVERKDQRKDMPHEILRSLDVIVTCDPDVEPGRGITF